MTYKTAWYSGGLIQFYLVNTLVTDLYFHIPGTSCGMAQLIWLLLGNQQLYYCFQVPYFLMPSDNNSVRGSSLYNPHQRSGNLEGIPQNIQSSPDPQDAALHNRSNGKTGISLLSPFRASGMPVPDTGSCLRAGHYSTLLLRVRLCQWWQS